MTHPPFCYLLLHTSVVFLAFKSLLYKPLLWKEHKINSIIAVIVHLVFSTTSLFLCIIVGASLQECAAPWLTFVGILGYFQGFCRLFAHILHKKQRKSCTVNLKCLPLHSLNKKHNGAIAQMVEQRTENPCVPGSIPGGTTLKESFFGVTLFLYTCHSSVGRAKD